MLQNRILEDQLNSEAFRYMGETLAAVHADLARLKAGFEPIKDSRGQFDERFYELKILLYNGRMDIFNESEDQFLSGNQTQLTWTDGDLVFDAEIPHTSIDVLFSTLDKVRSATLHGSYDRPKF